MAHPAASLVATPIRAMADTAVVDEAAAVKAAIAGITAVPGLKASKVSRASVASPVRVHISKAAKIAANPVVKVNSADSGAGAGAAAAGVIAARAAVAVAVIVAHVPKASKVAARFDWLVN